MLTEISTAFFDFDETVISFKSMFSFLEYYWRERYPGTGEQQFINYMSDVRNKWQANVPREVINFNYYQQFSGESLQSILDIRQQWIEAEKARYGTEFYLAEVQQLIHDYHQQKISVVIVSGSMKEIIMPLAQEIGADAVLATNMVTVNGLFTGEILAPQTIGQGKAMAVTNYMLQHGIDRERTIAWGDHDSDFPMLEAAGSGGIISGNQHLLTEAWNRGFFVINRSSDIACVG